MSVSGTTYGPEPGSPLNTWILAVQFYRSDFMLDVKVVFGELKARCQFQQSTWGIFNLL